MKAIFAGAAVAALVIAAFVIGSDLEIEQQGGAEQIGERIDEGLENAEDQLNNAAEDLEDGVNSAADDVEDATN